MDKYKKPDNSDIFQDLQIKLCTQRFGILAATKVKKLKNVFSSYGHEFFLNSSDIGTSEVYPARPRAQRT